MHTRTHAHSITYTHLVRSILSLATRRVCGIARSEGLVIGLSRDPSTLRLREGALVAAGSGETERKASISIRIIIAAVSVCIPQRSNGDKTRPLLTAVNFFPPFCLSVYNLTPFEPMLSTMRELRVYRRAAVKLVWRYRAQNLRDS